MRDDKEIKVQLEALFSELSDLPMIPEDASAPLEARPIVERQPAAEATIFHALVENITDAISISNLDGYQTYGNRACYENFGYNYERQEMKGLPLASLWLAEDIPTLTEQVLPQALSDSWSGEARQRRKDGAIFDARLTAFSVKTSSGEPISIATIVRDISRLKALENERDTMYEHRAFQIQLIAGLAREIAAAPTLDELYRRVVTLVKERFGYYHVQVFHYIPELSAMALVRSYVHAGQDAEPASYRLPYGTGIVGTAAVTGKPILVPDALQDHRWIRHPNFPNTRGELAAPIKVRDQVIGVLDVLSDTAGALTREDEIVLSDLTSRIASIIGNTHLLRKAENLRQLAQDPEGIGWIALEDETITYANAALCRILGAAQPKDILGKSIIACYPENLRERVQNEILPIVMQKGQLTGESAFLSAQGKITPIVQSIFLVRNENEIPLHLATVVTDIIEQKQAERLLDKRIQQIDYLHDIGQKIKEIPRLPDLLQWVAERIPAVMQYPDLCVVAVEFEGQIYGATEAMMLPCQITEPIRIGDEMMGRAYVSYTQKRDFLDEEKNLLGDIVRRVSNYIESRCLLAQNQASLEEVKASHRIYLPARWTEHAPQQPPEEHAPSASTKAPLRNSRVCAALRKIWQRLTV